jgi:sterol desaturase/sphingolipid hydroxylase (fatty acid hydroxylase superfamily)
MLWQIAYNIVGHSGYEVHPRWLMNTPLKYLMNTPTNHVMHHESMRGNYGLYFNFWDRLMGTNHATYEERFRQVTSPKKQPAPPADGKSDSGPPGEPRGLPDNL